MSQTALNWSHTGRRFTVGIPPSIYAQARRPLPLTLQNFGAVVSPWEAASPTLALYRRAFGLDQPIPVPAPEPPVSETTTSDGALFGLSVGMIAAVVVIAVALNYQYGKAMAPDKESQSRWAWSTAIFGTLFPPFILGTAIYKNYFLK